jgi:hypothetical protein
MNVGPRLVLGLLLSLGACGSASPAAGQAASPRPAVPVEPVSAILDAFQTHPIIALGEGPHGSEQGPAFRLALIRDPRLPIVSAAIASADRWKTYANRKFGFQFNYPPTSRVSDDGPSTSQSGTQPDDLASIAAYTNSGARQILIQVFKPDIVKEEYGWPERPCGEWTFGPDDRPLSIGKIGFAGQKTLHVVSRGFGRDVVTSNYYCVNYRRNPVVMIFDEPPSSETQRIVSSFKFLKTR